jgi:single-strand DNA-binding protein
VATSIEKGQRIVVVGTVRIRDWEAGEKTGTTIEITADSIGHDLNYGRAAFTRAVVTDRAQTRTSDRAEPHEALDAAAEPARSI